MTEIKVHLMFHFKNIHVTDFSSISGKRKRHLVLRRYSWTCIKVVNFEKIKIQRFILELQKISMLCQMPNIHC